MKPIKLVMSAFGPYRDKVEVDFEKLGSEGIFLITGDTGSGKTTIFDAISFALFGEASGSRRENGGFRSDFARNDVKTYVELEFRHKEVKYIVERVPRYMRRKIRGEGFTTVGGDATLTYLDQVVTGDKNVTDKCVEILGMNVFQFKQIAMIAQGEFLELLLAKPKDRASIFRRIFDTEIYKVISDELKNRYLDKRREYEDVGLSLERYKEGIIWNSEMNMDMGMSDLLDLLEKEIIQDQEEEKYLLTEKRDIDRNYELVIQQISEGMIINDSFDELEKDRLLLRELKENETEIKRKEVLVQKNRDIWEKVVPKYQELERIREEILAKERRLKQSQELYQKEKLRYEEMLLQFQKLNCFMEEVEQLKSLKREWEDKLSGLVVLSKLLCELDKKKLVRNRLLLLEKQNIQRRFEHKKLLELEIQEIKNKMVELKDEYLQKNQKYLNDYDFFLSSQVGILATTLKDNCPCPVCGSLTHPSIASFDVEFFSKEMLDQERQEVEKCYQHLEEFRLKLQDKEANLQFMLQELKGISFVEVNLAIRKLRKEILKDEGDYKIQNDDLDISISELDIDVECLNLQIEELKQKIPENLTKEMILVEVDKLDNKIKKKELDIERIRMDYEEQMKKKSEKQSLIQLLDADLVRLHKDLEDKNREYVKTYVELGYEKEEEYLEIQLEKEWMNQFDSSVQNYYEEVGLLGSKIKVLESVVNGKVRVDIANLEKKKYALNEKLDSINLSLKRNNNKLSNNIKIYDMIKSVYQKSTKLEHEVMVYKDLSDTANGMIVGKNKLEFEQFVQAGYFDRVLISANKRLGYMTEDRYQLVRKEEAIKLSDKLGLELEVMDYYTGKKRDIKSLSGGESFKAALSLALGMSDTIQSYSGGVVVDTMFIDEGFGSLDDDSLEQAMNAIMMLSKGNCMIGIISHVNELKSRIDKKIVVKKSSCGSSVSVVV